MIRKIIFLLICSNYCAQQKKTDDRNPYKVVIEAIDEHGNTEQVEYPRKRKSRYKGKNPYWDRDGDVYYKDDDGKKYYVDADDNRYYDKADRPLVYTVRHKPREPTDTPVDRHRNCHRKCKHTANYEQCDLCDKDYCTMKCKKSTELDCLLNCNHEIAKMKLTKLETNNLIENKLPKTPIRIQATPTFFESVLETVESNYDHFINHYYNNNNNSTNIEPEDDRMKIRMGL